MTRTIIFMLNLSPAFCVSSFHLLLQLGLACGVSYLTGGVVHAHIAIYSFLQSRFSPSEKALNVGLTLNLWLYTEKCFCKMQTLWTLLSDSKSTWTGWWSTNATSSHSVALGMSSGLGALHISSFPFLAFGFTNQHQALLNWWICFASKSFSASLHLP